MEVNEKVLERTVKLLRERRIVVPTFAEMRDLATRAGWQNFGHRVFPFARQAIWLE